MVLTIVQAPASATALSFTQRDKAATLSRPEVGSSRKSREGLKSSSIATHNLFLSPPVECYAYTSKKCTRNSLDHWVTDNCISRIGQTHLSEGFSDSLLSFFLRNGWRQAQFSCVPGPLGKVNESTYIIVSPTVKWELSWSSCIT